MSQTENMNIPDEAVEAAPNMLAPLIEALKVERMKVELLLELKRTPEEAARRMGSK